MAKSRVLQGVGYSAWRIGYKALCTEGEQHVTRRGCADRVGKGAPLLLGCLPPDG